MPGKLAPARTQVEHSLPPPFGIRLNNQGGNQTVWLSGELDLAEVAELERCLRTIGEARQPTVVDLSGLSFIDSTGVTALIRIKHSADTSGWQLDMKDPPPDTLRVMELMGVTRVLGLGAH